MCSIADVIRERSKPLMETGGTVILFGSLAPDGAVIKSVAADRRLWQHTGPAVVFKDFEDMEARVNNDDLESMKIPFSSFRMRGRWALPECRSGACFRFQRRY